MPDGGETSGTPNGADETLDGGDNTVDSNDKIAGGGDTSSEKPNGNGGKTSATDRGYLRSWKFYDDAWGFP